MRALLTAARLLTAVAVAQAPAAQEQPPQPGEVAPVKLPANPEQPPQPTPLDKQLAAVVTEIANSPHAFDGRLTWGPQPRPDVQIDPLDCNFVGGVAAHDDGELSWHSLLDWTVLQRGDRGATRHDCDGPAPGRSPVDETANDPSGWQSPQGDAPEVPLSPRLLLEQLPKATLSRPEPSEVEGRPALRVLATWTGKAAKAAVLAVAVPSSAHEHVIESLATFFAREQQVGSICAEIRYDPATKRWLAATLRILVTDGKPLPADEPPLPAPAGMPAPTGRPVIELIVTLRRRELAELPPPELDARARQLLRGR